MNKPSTESVVSATSILIIIFICSGLGGLAYYDEARHKWERENDKPVISLVVEHDGVRLWKCSYKTRHPIYFTSPTGDVTWLEQRGKFTEQMETRGNK